MAFILTVLAVFLLLSSCELYWRKREMHGEFSRKFVHISVGSFVAFWPFFLSWNMIVVLSVAFLIVVTASKQLKVFKAIHSVQRPTWGELFFALAVGGVTLVTHNKWIYMAALLQMSLADGLAAVMGVRYGQHSGYKVLGHTKSVTGSVTFLVISIIILVGFVMFSGLTLSAFALVGLALAAAIIENFGIQGLDNLLVPLLVAIGLRLLV